MTWENAVAGESIELLELFKITLHTGTVYHYTSFTQNTTFLDSEYTTAPISRSSLAQGVDFQSRNLTVKLPRHSDYVPTTKLLSRIYDNSTLELYQASRDNLSNYRMVFRGLSAGVVYDEHQIEIEFRDEMNLMRRPVPRHSYETSCPYRIYDSMCGLTQANFENASGVVESGSTQSVINDSTYVTEATDYWVMGYVQMTSGEATDETRLITSYVPGEITVLNEFAGTIAPDDTFTLVPHCQGKYNLCRDRFSNQDQFGGFLHIPMPEEFE